MPHRSSDRLLIGCGRQSSPLSARIVAAGSLGRVRDASADVCARALALVKDADAAPRDLGEAIVLLAQLDIESRRAAAIAALERLREGHPAWTRDLRAFSAVLALE